MRVRYGPLPPQWAALSVPEGAGPHRVCVLVHGGFWKAEHDASLMDDLAADLVARGWAAYNVEYRRLPPGPADEQGGDWPALFRDVAAAVDALADLADDHGLDLGRVAVAGHSAGGHLAAWIAGRRRLPGGAPGAGPRVEVRAAVAQAGVLDLAVKAAGGGEGARLVRALIGGDDRHRLAITSPVAMAPLGVPVLCVHGTADEVVPPSQSRRLAAVDQDATVLLAEGEEHMGHVVALNPMWRAAADWLDERVPR